MKGRTIEEVIEIGSGYDALYFDNGEVAVVKVVTPNLLKDLEDKVSLNPEKEEKPKPKEKEEKKPEAAAEPEASGGDESYNWKDLLEMDYAGLKELCDDNDLDTDPEDYDEDEVDKFREAVANEIEVEVPEAGETKPAAAAAETKDDEYTWEDLKQMDYDELSDLCDENELGTDPNDFDETDEEDKLRRAIAKEINITPPPAKKK